MKCPACKIELRPTASHDIALDECPQCGGVWFGQGELKKAIDSADNALRWIDFDLFADEEGKFAGSAGTEPCPHCGKPMTAVTYKGSGVAIHMCDACEGAWLPKGELEKMAAWLEDMVSSESLAQYEHDAAKQFRKIFTGPKGAVSETKDFFAVAKLLEYRAITEHPKLLAVLANIENHLPLK